MHTSFYSSAKISRSFDKPIHQRRPSGYRIMLKNRSGINDFESTNSYIDMNKFKTSQSFRGDLNDVKTFAKLMNPNRQSEGQSNSGDFVQKTHSGNITELSQQEADDILRDLSIEQLEKRVDDLIELKFNRLKEENLQKLDDNYIDNELKAIVSYLQRSEIVEENLESINQKIRIFEKVMAESLTQSEAIKKIYYGKLTNRKGKNHNLKRIKVAADLFKKMTEDLMERKMPSSIHLESLSKSVYKAPSPGDYPKKKSKPKFEFKNQPIPRSSYKRDFLTYGTLPKFNYKEQHKETIYAKSANPNTSYQAQFTPKKQELINFKELDCYRDKLQNLKLSFINLEEKAEPEKGRESKLEGYSTHKKKTLRYKTEQTHYAKTLTSQSQLNYTGEKPVIKSLIKHQNLNNLKYAFKTTLQV